MAPAVTPCMGVWIETEQSQFPHNLHQVTPCMGVWIETLKASTFCLYHMSHPVWVCGLKQF